MICRYRPQMMNKGLRTALALVLCMGGWTSLQAMPTRPHTPQAPAQGTTLALSPTPIRPEAGKSALLQSWQYKALEDSLWYATSVPSLVQQSLIDEGRLPQPWYRDNEARIQWPGERDWVYRTSFTLETEGVDPELRHRLELEGLDTYADIYLDGQLIGRSRNMFVPQRIDITDLLAKTREHHLVIHFTSPLRAAHAQYLSNGFNYPADNDHAPIHYSPFTRKAPYHYGWDWGMRLVTIGPWQPIRLSSYRSGRIDDCRIETEISWHERGKAQRAHLSLSPEVELWEARGGHRLVAQLYDARGKVVAEDTQELDSQENHRLSLEVDRPRLWWPRPWGEPYLYRLELRLEDAQGYELHRLSRSVGLRELRLVNEADSLGTSFSFEVNQYPLFIKGANYIPGELLLTRRRAEDFDRLMQDVAFAEMNMIRVWGGGVYEDDAFYDAADRAGILIWQDFMFACTAYPSDRDFLDNVRTEAVHQVKRLRHHPSIALWCGNNEVEEALKYWGWQRKFAPEHYQRMVEGYAPLFGDLLPRVVQAHAPEQAYIHGSPMQANWGRPESFAHGDIHYWGLWYGKQPFEIFDHRPMRMVSEFGFQSFPSMPSIARFAEPEDYGLETPVMRVHQKASTGNGLIREYMDRDYIVPKDFEDFVYVSQVLQARGMERVMRTLRSHRPICMGSLYWQLNDAWPAVSWSSIDYYHEYKAMHYTAARAYAPMALGVRLVGGDTLEIYGLLDDLDGRSGVRLRSRVYALSGELLTERILSRESLRPNSSQLLGRYSLASLGLSESLNSRVLHLELKTSSGTSELLWYAVPTKALELPEAKIQHRIVRQEAGRAIIELRADSFVKDLVIEVPELCAVRLSDNCFDMLRGQRRQIEVIHPDLRSGTKLRIKMHTMNQIHRP